MNITKYQSVDDGNKVYRGTITLKKGWYIAFGDECAYTFLGKNSCYPFYANVHPDDREEFMDALKTLPTEPQALTVRVRCWNGMYRCLYMVLQYDEIEQDGFRFVTIEFNDIMEIRQKYDKQCRNIKKYREFLGLSSMLFFEYDFKTGIFEIYRYLKTKSFPVLKGKLKEFQKEVNKREDLRFEEIVAYNTFCNELRTASDSFELTLSAAVFNRNLSDQKFEVHGSTMYENDQKSMVAGILRPTGTVKKKEAYYFTEAARDVGTGLLNKRAINEFVIEKIEKKSPMYIIIMDIDDFKKINDTFGHMQGDCVLSKVAEIIRSVARTRCTAGRFGGDEFFLVLENVESEAALRIILKTICKHLRWIYQKEMSGLQVTTSMGIAKYPEDGRTYEELFKKADKSLYIAKAKGKNRFIIYDEKKHGAIEQLDDNDRVIGVSAVVDNTKRTGVISEIVSRLNSNRAAAVPEVLELLRKYFDIDGVTVYAGDTPRILYTTGKYSNQIQIFGYLTDKYLEKFNSNQVYSLTNIHKLEMDYPKLYQALAKQETAEFIHFLLNQEGKPAVFITYDVFNRSRKWSEFDISMITIASRLIGEVLIEKLTA